MRISEAIRIGSLLRPQAFGAHFSEDGGSCATGAAMEAIGIEPAVPVITDVTTLIGNPIYVKWRATPGYVRRFDLVCPVCGDPCLDKVYTICGNPSPGGLVAIIVHLNNEHWTREQIADWVEQVEREAGLWDTVEPEPGNPVTAELVAV